MTIVQSRNREVAAPPLLGSFVALPVLFEQPGAPPPVTELGGSQSPLGEPYASETVAPPAYPEIFRSMTFAERRPVICDGLAVTVRFDLGAATPVADDAERLNSFAQSLACPRSKLVVAGFTDSTGPEPLNIDLSLSRALTVIDQMQPYGDMFVWRDANAYAEAYQAVPTADNVNEPANRRAEVYLDFFCPEPSEIAKSLAPGETYVPGQDARPYPGTYDQPEPVVVALQQRDLSVLPDADTLAWLEDTAAAVQQDIAAPTGMVFPMIVDGACLTGDQNVRIDVIYSDTTSVTLPPLEE